MIVKGTEAPRIMLENARLKMKFLATFKRFSLVLNDETWDKNL